MLENIRKRAAAGFFGRRGAHSNFVLGLAAVLLVDLGGCAVGPDFAPPVAPVADHWLEWRSKSLQSGPEEYRDWWGVFHDPILDRLIDIAYSQNLTLLSAGTKVLQARAELGVAIGEFFPQKQQAVGAVTYNLLSQANPAANPTTGIVNFWADAIGVKAAWELDFWGKFRRGVEFRRFRLSGFHRKLRRCPCDSPWRCRNHLHRYPHA